MPPLLLDDEAIAIAVGPRTKLDVTGSIPSTACRKPAETASVLFG